MANIEMKRVNIKIPKKLTDYVENFSDNLGVPYTQGYIILLNKVIEQDKAVEGMTESLKLLKELQVKINEETKQIGDYKELK